MSSASASATTQAPGITVETVPSVAANDVAQADRKQIPVPEAIGLQVPETAVTSQAVMPPKSEIKLPQPPIHLAGTAAPAANDETYRYKAEEKQIEQYLSTFIGDRLPAGMGEGLMVDVTLVNSNAVTSEGEPDRHDIAVAFKGGKLEDPKVAQTLAEQLRAAMREHPAFGDMHFGGIETKIEHMMRSSILALEPERLKALLTPQPRKHVTFIAPPEQRIAANDEHCTHGANCAHCAATKVETPAVAAAAAVDASTQAATPIAPAPKPAEPPKPETPAIQPPAIAESKPEAITAMAPEMSQVAAPASTIETPAVNEATLAPEKLVANGVAR